MCDVPTNLAVISFSFIIFTKTFHRAATEQPNAPAHHERCWRNASVGRIERVQLISSVEFTHHASSLITPFTYKLHDYYNVSKFFSNNTKDNVITITESIAPCVSYAQSHDHYLSAGLSLSLSVVHPLLNRNGLRQIPRLIHIGPLQYRHVVSEQLQRDGKDNG